MNLEEIITAAVEKRVAELVAEAVNGRPEDFRSNNVIYSAISKLVDEIARKEVAKHAEDIRFAIQKTLVELPTTLEVRAYSEITFPKKKEDR